MNINTKTLGLTGVLTIFSSIAFSQQATCSSPVAQTNIIRGEGTTEQVSQLSFICVAFGNSAPAGVVNVQVFLSPSLPVTSKVLSSSTGTTEALIQVNGQTPGTNAFGAAGSVQGTVSGSTINFSGVQVPALTQGGTYTFVISNVRVNATSLALGSGIPPTVSETIFISSSGSVIPAALPSVTVAFAVNGLGTSDLRKVFTTGAGAPGTATGWPVGRGSIAGANSFAVCNAYSPAIDDINVTAPGAVSGSSLAFVVRVAENFASAFSSLSGEQPQVSVTSPSANTVVAGTRLQVTFSSVPANVSLFVPNGRMNSSSSSAAAQLTAAGTFAPFAAVAGTTSSAVVTSTTGLAGSLAQIAISAGSGLARFEIVTADLTNLDTFDIPVYIVTSANTVPLSAIPISVSVSYSPTGSTAIPNFAVSSNTVSLNGSTFNGCNVSQSITFAAPAAALAGTPVNLNATATSGLPVSFASNSLSVCTVSGSAVTLLGAGTCSITATQAGNGTYAPAVAITQFFSVTAASQTITFSQPADAVLGSGTVPLTASASSGLAVSFASTISSVCTVNGSTATLVSVGICAVTASQAGNGSNLAATPVTRTFGVLAPTNLVTLTVGNGSGTTGGTVELPVTLATAGTAAASGFQTDLGFDAAKLSYVSARVGEKSVAAAKGLSSSVLANGQIRLLVSGINQNAIAAGTVAYASFKLTGGFTSGTSAITAANCASTDIAGNPIITSCNGGSVKYASCDINADGSANVSDVQLIINEALGVVASTHDLNSDGLVNVADVQIVINAALGLGCNVR